MIYHHTRIQKWSHTLFSALQEIPIRSPPPELIQCLSALPPLQALHLWSVFGSCVAKREKVYQYIVLSPQLCVSVVYRKYRCESLQRMIYVLFTCKRYSFVCRFRLIPPLHSHWECHKMHIGFCQSPCCLFYPREKDCKYTSLFILPP